MHHCLVLWPNRSGDELTLPYAGTTVRAQGTRWASCSPNKMINLNYKLIVLPPELVPCVFLHEFCHTIHLNHLPGNWHLVYTKELDYRRCESALKRANVYILTWVDDQCPGWALR